MLFNSSNHFLVTFHSPDHLWVSLYSHNHYGPVIPSECHFTATITSQFRLTYLITLECSFPASICSQCCQSLVIRLRYVLSNALTFPWYVTNTLSQKIWWESHTIEWRPIIILGKDFLSNKNIGWDIHCLWVKMYRFWGPSHIWKNSL